MGKVLRNPGCATRILKWFSSHKATDNTFVSNYYQNTPIPLLQQPLPKQERTAFVGHHSLLRNICGRFTGIKPPDPWLCNALLHPSKHPNILQNKCPCQGHPPSPCLRTDWRAVTVLQHMKERHPVQGAAWQALQGNSKSFSC